MLIIELEAENLINEIKTMIHIMIEILETEIEILINPAVMTQGAEGHVLAQGIMVEIMTVIGEYLHVLFLTILGISPSVLSVTAASSY